MNSSRAPPEPGPFPGAQPPIGLGQLGQVNRPAACLQWGLVPCCNLAHCLSTEVEGGRFHSGNGSGDGTLIRVAIIEYNAAVIEDSLKGGIGAGSGAIECPGEG